MIANDHAAEAAAIKAYNEAIHLAAARGTRPRELLEKTLKDEEATSTGSRRSAIRSS